MNEGGESIQPEIKTSVEKPSVEKVIESRFKQNNTERLVEYVTGLKIDDPKLIDKLENDQKEIRTKYGLPDRGFKFEDPDGYERYLRQLAKDNEIEIKSKADFPEFFEKYKLAGGFSSEDGKTVALDINRTGDREYVGSLTFLEHEMIHSLQKINTPDMNIEQQEYEAYVVAWNMDYFKGNDYAVSFNFDFAVGSSIDHWYKETSEETGKKVEAEYKNPEYFLKNVDGINEEEIQKYKSEHLKELSNEQIIDFRFEQTRASRLAEYVTGIRPEQSVMVEKLIEDKKKIREKYGLLNEKMKGENPTEYEKYLRNLAKKNNIDVASKSECGSLFIEYDDARGIYLNEGKIGVNIDRNGTKENYIEDLDVLEHELIHGLQDKLFPGMPIELREYEAYLAGGNNEMFREIPEEIEYVVFQVFMGGSLDIDYKMTSERTGKVVEPEWDKPEYFLKNKDGVSDEKIKEYKEKQSLDNVRV